MNGEAYQAALDVTALLRELQRLLLVQHRTDRLICRYLADLADGIVKWPALLLAYGDVYEFVRAKFGLSLRSTRERVRVGRALRTLPVLDAALTSGQVTYSRIREVTRVAQPDTERIWLHAAQRLSIRALERRVVEAGGRRDARDQQPCRNRATEPEDVSVNVPREIWTLVVQAMQVANAAHGSDLGTWQALAEVARSAMAHHGASPIDRMLACDGPAADREPASPLGTEPSEPLASGPAAHGPPPGDSNGPPSTHSGSSDIAAPPSTHSGLSDVTAPSPASPTGRPSGARSKEVAGRQQDGLPPTGSEVWTPAAAREREFGAPALAREPDPAAGAPLTDHRGRPLSADVRLLYRLMATGKDWNVATLAEATGMPTPRLTTALFDLECARLVSRDVMGFFEVRQKQAG